MVRFSCLGQFQCNKPKQQGALDKDDSSARELKLCHFEARHQQKNIFTATVFVIISVASTVDFCGPK